MVYCFGEIGSDGGSDYVASGHHIVSQHRTTSHYPFIRSVGSNELSVTQKNNQLHPCPSEQSVSYQHSADTVDRTILRTKSAITSCMSIEESDSGDVILLI